MNPIFLNHNTMSWHTYRAWWFSPLYSIENQHGYNQVFRLLIWCLNLPSKMYQYLSLAPSMIEFHQISFESINKYISGVDYLDDELLIYSFLCFTIESTTSFQNDFSYLLWKNVLIDRTYLFKAYECIWYSIDYFIFISI